ncbi:MAG: hypothetical protein AAF329_11770 [Cyanobacteria bacterium P01_A01_bin.17]
MQSEPVQSSWYLVLGRSPQPLSNVTWRDEGLAIVGMAPVVGGQERWVVVGDVWLSDRDGSPILSLPFWPSWAHQPVPQTPRKVSGLAQRTHPTT